MGAAALQRMPFCIKAAERRWGDIRAILAELLLGCAAALKGCF